MTLWGVHQRWCGMYFHTWSVYTSVEIAKIGHNHSPSDWNTMITIYNWHIIILVYYTVYNLLNHCFRKSRWFLERIKFTSDYHIQQDGLWSSPLWKVSSNVLQWKGLSLSAEVCILILTHIPLFINSFQPDNKPYEEVPFRLNTNTWIKLMLQRTTLSPLLCIILHRKLVIY